MLALVESTMFNVALSLALTCLAQDPAASEDAELAKRWLAYSLEQAEKYSIGPQDESLPRFQRLKEPIFRHAQPARGNDVGSVFLWVDDQERPRVVGDIFAWSTGGAAKRNISQEFHSFADGPVNAQWGDRLVWRPKREGLTWTAVPEGPAVAKTKVQRMRQARDLSRQFTAFEIDNDGGRWELRILPQPVHTFHVEGAAGSSGAMFAVCQGTDPEMWLLLETRSGPEGTRWHYACASFTDYALEALLKDQKVWSCARYIHGSKVNDEPHWIELLEQGVLAPEHPKTP